MTARAAFLAALLAAATGQESDLRVLALRIDPSVTGDYRRGVEFGLAEAKQTAGLMGRAVTIADGGTAGEITMSAAAGPETVPVVQLAAGTRGACAFSVAPAGPEGVAWHPALNRYGAAQVNERYLNTYGTGMTAEAWLGWFAVKALVDNALRATDETDLCASMTTTRFDGHKGRPLTFDPATRVLRQPLYVVRDGRVVREVQ